MTYTLIPPSCFLVGCARAAIIAELDLIELSKVLLVGGCAAEVAFAAIMGDGLVQTSCGCLWVILAVGLCIDVRRGTVFQDTMVLLKASVSVLASSSGSFSC